MLDRKMPLMAEAIKYDGMNLTEIKRFALVRVEVNTIVSPWSKRKFKQLTINTVEGPRLCSEGDYIVKGLDNEIYVFKPDEFEKYYGE